MISQVIKQLKIGFHPKTIKNKLLHYALTGDEVECVCCGAKYSTFLPAGIQKRSNAKCINCGSLERHRSLWMFFKEQNLLTNKPIRLLHVAPEKIFYDQFKSLPNIEYFPIDLMPDEYSYGINTIQMDVTQMTFQDNYFDGIICNHVLEHIREDQKAMREMSRVLKPGGWAILNTPVNLQKETTHEDVNLYDPQKQLELFGQPDHVRVYGRDFLDRVTNAGFTAEVINYVSNFSNNDKFKYGLKDQEAIFYCSKY